MPYLNYVLPEQTMLHGQILSFLLFLFFCPWGLPSGWTIPIRSSTALPLRPLESVKCIFSYLASSFTSAAQTIWNRKRWRGFLRGGWRFIWSSVRWGKVLQLRHSSPDNRNANQSLTCAQKRRILHRSNHPLFLASSANHPLADPTTWR